MCKCLVRPIPRATIRAKFFTGTYILQVKPLKINKFDPDPSCHLCDAEAEDAPHFLIRCRELTITTHAEMAKLKKPLVRVYGAAAKDR